MHIKKQEIRKFKNKFDKKGYCTDIYNQLKQ